MSRSIYAMRGNGDFCIHTVFVMRRPTNGKPAPPPPAFLCSKVMIDTPLLINTNAIITGLNKKEEVGAGLRFVCTRGSNTRFQFNIETRKIEGGIAVMPLFSSLTTCLMYRNSLGRGGS